MQVGSEQLPEVRNKAFTWLAEWTNTFVRVVRPRVRSAAADYQSRGDKVKAQSPLPTHPPKTFRLASSNDWSGASRVVPTVHRAPAISIFDRHKQLSQGHRATHATAKRPIIHDERLGGLLQSRARHSKCEHP